MKKKKLSSNLFRFMIIILPISYNNNVLYFFLIHKSSFVNMPDKKNKKFCFQSIKQNFGVKRFVTNTTKRKNVRQRADFYVCKLILLMPIPKFGL